MLLQPSFLWRFYFEVFPDPSPVLPHFEEAAEATSGHSVLAGLR